MVSGRPAHVGSRPRRRDADGRLPGASRARGEPPRGRVVRGGLSWGVLRTWGAANQVFPRTVVNESFPRTRGTTVILHVTILLLTRPSPRTRGSRRRGRDGRLSQSAFPAHAGLPPETLFSVRCSAGLPRARGAPLVGPRLTRPETSHARTRREHQKQRVVSGEWRGPSRLRGEPRSSPLITSFPRPWELPSFSTSPSSCSRGLPRAPREPPSRSFALLRMTEAFLRFLWPSCISWWREEQGVGGTASFPGIRSSSPACRPVLRQILPLPLRKRGGGRGAGGVGA